MTLSDKNKDLPTWVGINNQREKEEMAFPDRRTIIVSDDVLFQELGGIENEMVLLDMRSGGYFGLNEVGSRIWDLIHEADHVGGIIEVLLDEYDVPRDALKADVEEFLSELSQRGLIQVNEATPE